MYHFDVLIVGAGPTGLMLACQLKRFDISFKIIDRHVDRVHESRAFGIQSRSMEIFQNLNLIDEFLKKVNRGTSAQLYFNGKEKLKLTIENFHIQGAPYPYVYFLPQNETEEILISHLQKQNVFIDRETELFDFTQNETSVFAEVKNLQTNQIEKMTCQYIIGCDGAHSSVRKILNIDFEGAAYQQEFMLADCEVNWKFPKDNSFRIFIAKKGIFGILPLPHDLDRVMAAKFKNNFKAHTCCPHTHPDKNTMLSPASDEIEQLGAAISKSPIKIKNLTWSSRFHLHHRAVKNYQKGRAFIGGDAAHIHTPVGGQGMNTGLQDMTNLAWKLAFVIKYNAPTSLLETYQMERYPIGKMLVKTTDRIFGLLTSQNFIIKFLRFKIMPIIMQYINKKPNLQQKIFLFISQLTIHYNKNYFIDEEITHADNKFITTLGAGYRAPDAQYEETSLFEIFKKTACNILILHKEKLNSNQINQLSGIAQVNLKLINMLKIEYSDSTRIIFDRYGVTNSAIYFIRPDGYIGFRSYGLKIDLLFQYLQKFFGMNDLFMR